MKVLLSGGCKNGKTGTAADLALRLAGTDGRRIYVATMIPYDDEDRARVSRHIEERAGMGFETLEIGRNIASALDAGPDAVYLVDSVTALLLNEMFSDPESAEADPHAADRCREGLLRLAAGAKHAIFVTDYIYSDAERYDSFTETYRKNLASLDRALASVCDIVIELCAGIPVFHKGSAADLTPGRES